MSYWLCSRSQTGLAAATHEAATLAAAREDAVAQRDAAAALEDLLEVVLDDLRASIGRAQNHPIEVLQPKMPTVDDQIERAGENQFVIGPVAAHGGEDLFAERFGFTG